MKNKNKKQSAGLTNFNKLINESPNTIRIVVNPNDMEKLIKQGVIEKKFITYNEYADKLYAERKKSSVALLTKLPRMSDSIADSIASNIYEEIRASYAFGVFTSAIFNSILLLEYAMRNRLYQEMLKKNPNLLWSELEKQNMGGLIPQLKKSKIINEEEKLLLKNFSEKLRNPYLHFNIYKLIKGIAIGKLPSFDIKTEELTEELNIDATKYRFMWFSAKKFFDNERVQYVIDFCVLWTNKLLIGTK